MQKKTEITTKATKCIDCGKKPLQQKKDLPVGYSFFCEPCALRLIDQGLSVPSSNPVQLLDMFLEARLFKRPIPEWILDRLAAAFKQHLECEGERSLDVLLGLSPLDGKRKPYTVKAGEKRDHSIFPDILILQMLGFTLSKAAATLEKSLALRKECKKIGAPMLSKNSIETRYKREGWKKDVETCMLVVFRLGFYIKKKKEFDRFLKDMGLKQSGLRFTLDEARYRARQHLYKIAPDLFPPKR